jgi:hypothetical protein
LVCFASGTKTSEKSEVFSFYESGVKLFLVCLASGTKTSEKSEVFSFYSLCILKKQ